MTDFSQLKTSQIVRQLALLSILEVLAKVPVSGCGMTQEQIARLLAALGAELDRRLHG